MENVFLEMEWRQFEISDTLRQLDEETDPAFSAFLWDDLKRAQEAYIRLWSAMGFRWVTKRPSKFPSFE